MSYITESCGHVLEEIEVLGFFSVLLLQKGRQTGKQGQSEKEEKEL